MKWRAKPNVGSAFTAYLVNLASLISGLWSEKRCHADIWVCRGHYTLQHSVCFIKVRTSDFSRWALRLHLNPTLLADLGALKEIHDANAGIPLLSFTTLWKERKTRVSLESTLSMLQYVAFMRNSKTILFVWWGGKWQKGQVVISPAFWLHWNERGRLSQSPASVTCKLPPCCSYWDVQESDWSPQGLSLWSSPFLLCAGGSQVSCLHGHCPQQELRPGPDRPSCQPRGLE